MTEAAAPPPAAAPHHLTRGRKIAVWSLIVLATLIGLISILTIWVNRQMLNNDSFKKASAQLVRDPEVRGALSVYLVNQLYNNVDVSGQLENQLPNNLKPLAGPVAAGLRQPATDAVAFLLSQGRVQQIWINSTALAHQQLVNVLENKTGAGIDTGNGVVTVDLEPAREGARHAARPPGLRARQAPGKHGPDRGHALRPARRGADRRSGHPGRERLHPDPRPRPVRARDLPRARPAARDAAEHRLGVRVRRPHRARHSHRRRQLRDQHLTTATYRTPAHHVWLIETSILGELGRAVIIYGIVGVLGAVLAGPTHAAIAVRRWMAPMLRERPGLSWGILGFVYLLIILWGPTHALRTLWGILFLGALIAFGFELIRRQTIREFPDATFAHAAASAKALGAKAAAMRPKGSGGGSAADELARLNELHKSGALTDDEFAQAKARALT